MSFLTLISILAALGLVIFVCVMLFRENRLLLWCMIASPILIGVSVVSVFAVSQLLIMLGIIKPPGHEEKEVLVAIATQKQQEKEKEKPPPPPPPEPEPEKPKPKPEDFELPQGKSKADPDAKEMPKGSRLDTDTTGKPGPKDRKPGASGDSQAKDKPAGAKDDSKSSTRPDDFVLGPTTDDGTVIDDEKGMPGGGLGAGEGLTGTDISGLGKNKGLGGYGKGEGGGDEGEDYGIPDGKGNKIPQGWENGTANGKLYFVRLKHGKGAWGSFEGGVGKLMAFIDDKNIMRAERKSRTMTAEEMKQQYMKRNKQPTFLYMYVDSSFVLSGTEVSILREYINKGGFLFIDGRPDELDKIVVRRELGKVFPGKRFTAISNSHVINKFIFTLPVPAFGTNIIDKKNYGISDGNRLVAFYTAGNFANFYESYNPNADEYTAAQFQMGVNIIFYANDKGVQSRRTFRGASAKINVQQMEKLGLIEKAKPKDVVAPDATPPSVKKVKPNPTPQGTPGAAEPEPEPDDIDVLGEQ